MNFKNYVWSFKNCLPLNFCDDLVKYGNGIRESQATVHGNYSGKQLEKQRISHVAWLNDWWIWRHMHPCVNLANENAGWNFEHHSRENMQFTKYKLNGHYDWHCDANTEPYNDINTPHHIGRIRKLSMTIPLVDGSEYEGGDFMYKLPTGEEIVVEEARTKGSVIVFPSFVQHKVAPVTSGKRYSLVCWILGWPFK